MNKTVLVAMRAKEMRRVHPDTVFTYDCAKCGARLGVYPSGQAIIREHGLDNVTLLCSHCMPEGRFAPAPGALEEIAQSIENPKREGVPVGCLCNPAALARGLHYPGCPVHGN